MKYRVQLRIICLIIAMLLTGVGIAFLTLKFQKTTDQLRNQLTKVDSESFLIADKFRDSLRRLNETLYYYGRSYTPIDTNGFNKACRELNLWISLQKPKLATSHEKAIMNKIETNYNGYLGEARALLNRLVAIGDAAASMDEYTNLRNESQELYDLGEELARAHEETRNQLLADANQTIGKLRGQVLVSLSLLFILTITLGSVVYRDMILPLRVKLVESQTLLGQQEKLASLGLLAAGVAHEIRNPLTAIKAALFIQQKKFRPGTPEAADAKIIDREIQRLERIVNDFLLFARPGDSKLVPMTADVPLRDVHALLSPQLDANNVHLVLGETPPLPIRADADQIRQVLINLIQNAAEASPPDGIVKLNARFERKRLAGKDTGVVLLEVEDEGKGIPPDIQKRLFDPFFTTKETGTGLGLSIAANIVHAHGGVLQYQTLPELGTTFGVVLPVAES